MGNINYDTILGSFAQDGGSTTGIPAIPARFGLLDHSPERWTRFVEHVEQLNHNSDSNTKHKVIFFGRHGEGFHNVAEAKYGTRKWDDYWSKLNGNGGIVWGPDPELTAIGIGQAVTANEAWKAELPFGTCDITFREILPDNIRRAVVTENCREENGVHTCDKRRMKSYIQQTFPLFDVEPGFTEDDTLWDEHTRETKAQLAERARKVLDGIFENDKETFISITAHGGIINGFLKNLDRSPYALPTGGVLPVIVRAVSS